MEIWIVQYILMFFLTSSIFFLFYLTDNGALRKRLLWVFGSWSFALLYIVVDNLFFRMNYVREIATIALFGSLLFYHIYLYKTAFGSVKNFFIAVRKKFNIKRKSK